MSVIQRYNELLLYKYNTNSFQGIPISKSNHYGNKRLIIDMIMYSAS